MLSKRFSTLLLFFFVLLGFTACSNKDKDAINEIPGEIPGMGNSNEMPQGNLFQLPDGIRLATTIKGDGCDTTYEVGSGHYVDLCVALINTTGADKEISFPAGLVFVADDRAANQSGLLIQGVKIKTKAGKTVRCTVRSFCINAGKHPSSDSYTYQLGPVTNSILIGQLIELLKNKKTNIEDYPNEDAYTEATSRLQSYVWSITDGTGLSDFDKNEIRSLPNK